MVIPMLETFISDAPDPDAEDNAIGELFMEDPLGYLDITEVSEMLSTHGKEAESKIIDLLNDDVQEDDFVSSGDVQIAYEFNSSPLDYFESYAKIARMLKEFDESTYNCIKNHLSDPE